MFFIIPNDILVIVLSEDISHIAIAVQDYIREELLLDNECVT